MKAIEFKLDDVSMVIFTRDFATKEIVCRYFSFGKEKEKGTEEFEGTLTQFIERYNYLDDEVIAFVTERID